MKAILPSAGIALLLALNLRAQPEPRLYAVTFYDRQFITIDVKTGAGTLITNLLPAGSLDIATQGEKLWLLSGGSSIDRLRELDAWMGAILQEKSFATSISGGEGAMDFAPDGSVIASKSTDNVGTLFRIDLAQTNVVAITTNGGLAPSLDGLAFDADGVLYGLSQNNAGSHALHVVNTNKGTTAAVGDLGITFPGTGGAVAGLAFGPDGTLFAALGNPTESRLYRVNKFTGAATLVGSIGFPGVSGLRFFVPPPGPLAISREAGELRLSWPHARGGALEAATAVTGLWSRITLPLGTNGTEAFTLVPRDTPEEYFRLSH